MTLNLEQKIDTIFKKFIGSKETIIGFNIIREIAWSSSSPDLAEIYLEFFSHFELNQHVHFTDIEHLLGDFCKAQFFLGKKGTSVPGMRGPSSTPGEDLIILKSPVNVRFRTYTFAHPDIFEPIAVDIAALVRTRGPSDYEVQRLLSSRLHKADRNSQATALNSIPNTTPVRPPTAAKVRKKRGGQTTTAGETFVPTHDDIWWFTRLSDIQAEERKFRPRKFLERSGYLAGLKGALGLLSPAYDFRSDQVTSAANPSGPLNSGQILIQIAIGKHAAHTLDLRQPNNFSRGYPNLFVSRLPEPSAFAGRTVRLAVHGCDHQQCQCGSSGLGEGIAWAEQLCTTPPPVVRSFGYVFNRDMHNYRVPDVPLIRDRAK